MDYISSCRSNYFKVKDIKKFVEFCKKCGIDFISQEDRKPYTELTEENLVGFTSNNGIPPTFMEDDDYEDIDFVKLLSEHLGKDEVAIVQEVGSEGMRYLAGYAFAVNSKGEIKDVGINQIYGLAKTLTKKGKKITPCEY